MSSISDEKAIITLEVELVSGVKGLESVDSSDSEIDPFFDDVSPDAGKSVKQAVDDSISEAIEDALEEQGLNSTDIEHLSSLVKDVDSQGIQNITNFSKNPSGFMENTMMSVLARAGPHGALVAAIISSIVASPELVKAVVTMLGAKGAPLNQDFRFSEEEFLSLMFDRRVQFKRLTGDDPVITFNSVGFVTPADPDFAGNSLVDVSLARTARIGLRDNSHGYIHGI